MANVIRLLQDLSNGIRRTFVRHFARFQLTRPGAREVSTSCVSHMASAERDPIMEVWCGAFSGVQGQSLMVRGLFAS